MPPFLAQLEQSFQRSPLVPVVDTRLQQKQVELWLKRDDLIHPVISGNKWRKLKYGVDHALTLGCDAIVSMGGAHSNHLHALAYLGKILGLQTIGYIRGEQNPKPTATLSDLAAWGMQLRFTRRSEYRILRTYPGWQDLPGILPNQYWLPEGGAQTRALAGVAEMVREMDIPYDYLCLACGTGATLAGAVGAVPDQTAVLGFAVFKHAEFLSEDINRWIGPTRKNWQVNPDYHFGGFAKITPELMAFIEYFQARTRIPLEPVYTGKMLYGLFDLIKKDYFRPGQRIIAVHTGGLQGNRGFYGHLNTWVNASSR